MILLSVTIILWAHTLVLCAYISFIVNCYIGTMSIVCCVTHILICILIWCIMSDCACANPIWPYIFITCKCGLHVHSLSTSFVVVFFLNFQCTIIMTWYNLTHLNLYLRILILFNDYCCIPYNIALFPWPPEVLWDIIVVWFHVMIIYNNASTLPWQHDFLAVSLIISKTSKQVSYHMLPGYMQVICIL